MVYPYLRDGFYFLLPIAALCAGIGIYKDDTSFHAMLRGIIIACIVITAFNYFDYILVILHNPVISLNARYGLGLDSNAALIGFILLISIIRYSSLVFSSRTNWILIILFITSIVVSLSRTNILIALAATVFPAVNRIISGRILMLIIFVSAGVIVFAAPFLDISTNTVTTQSFIEKIYGSVSEVMVRDLSSLQEINENWRAYEAFLGIEKYLSGTVVELFFGQGFGSSVSASYIFDEKFQVIPIFHNGFITVILKTGLIGVFIYYYFFLRILVSAEKINLINNDKLKFALIKLMCISLLIKTFFVMGIYTNKSQVFELIVLGAALKGVLIDRKRQIATNYLETNIV